MKTFNDLEFNSHPLGKGLQAKLFFENGYGISVVRFTSSFGYGSYTRNEDEWEVAVLYRNKESCDISYTTHITDNVIGNLTADEVTDVMKQIQELKA